MRDSAVGKYHFNVGLRLKWERWVWIWSDIKSVRWWVMARDQHTETHEEPQRHLLDFHYHYNYIFLINFSKWVTYQAKERKTNMSAWN